MHAAALLVVVLSGFVLSSCDENIWMTRILEKGRKPEAPWEGPPGSGTANDPWIVHDVETLRKVGGNIDGWTLNAHYLQVRSIDLIYEGNWEPVAGGGGSFTGSYDGGGRSIISMSMKPGYDTSMLGLFAQIGAGGEVKNLTLRRLSVRAAPGSEKTGGIAGVNGGAITNCFVQGNVEGGSSETGGIAGDSGGKITNCSFSGTVSGAKNIGGIAGQSDGTVENCWSTGSVTGGDLNVGGIAGENNGTIEKCYSTGDITGDFAKVGGIAGIMNNNDALVQNCYSTGNVTGTYVGPFTSGIGGIVGGIDRGLVANCYSSGIVKGDSGISGIGIADRGSLENCVALGPSVESLSGLPQRVGLSELGSIANNYARKDMLLNGNTVSGGAVNNKDGADITQTQWSSQSWWSGTAQFDLGASGAWEWNSATKLPVLKGFPAGTQNHTVEPGPGKEDPVNPDPGEPGDPAIPGMAWIEPGTFQMGSPANEPGRGTDEGPQHSVTLTQGFYMGIYPVTQKQWADVMGASIEQQPSFANFGLGDNYPMYFASWYDALVFCNKLSVMEGLTPAYSISGSTDPADWGAVPTAANSAWDAVTVVAGSAGYRLPTEAQWEYACRAGTTTAYNTGAAISNDTVWYNGNSGGATHEAGLKPANAWGLYDMHGNVWEWCWDWYDANYYASSPASDPAGASSGSNRVIRGGSWSNVGQALRSAIRGDYSPSWRDYGIGFRLLRP